MPPRTKRLDRMAQNRRLARELARVAVAAGTSVEPQLREAPVWLRVIRGPDGDDEWLDSDGSERDLGDPYPPYRELLSACESEQWQRTTDPANGGDMLVNSRYE